MSFWSRFWCLLGPFWSPKTTPFGDPNRPKISPKPVLRRLCFKNVVFQNMSPALGESTILTLLGSQDGTKIDPRSPQDRLKIVLKRDRFLSRFLIDFWSSWAPFWLPLGAQDGAKNRPKSIKKTIGNWTAPSVAPRALQDRPRHPQDPPKSAPRSPKSAPRPPKTTPRPPKSSLRDPQDPPTCPQELPRSPPSNDPKLFPKHLAQ